MKICKDSECTGCYACYNICPKKCIELVPNEIGHIVPYIDEDICINCGLCIKVCPNNIPVIQKDPLSAYASWSLNEKDRRSSSSGGAASVFSNYIINKGGVVYGAAVKEGGNVCHIRVDNSSDLYKLKGSKYVQSWILDSYKLVKKDLLENKTVLFIGTPCQVAGLKNYINNDYESLITIDIICHGVPPQQLLNEHICDTIDDLDVDYISFRENNEFVLRVSKGKETRYCKSLYTDLYYMGFMKGLFYRESCYSCKYASTKRISDITIGDFWGLGALESLNHSKDGGVSLLLPITRKGYGLINECKEFLFLEERELTEAIQGNHQLRKPSSKNKNTDKFKTLYKNQGFKKAAKKCLRFQRVKYKLLDIYRGVK